MEKKKNKSKNDLQAPERNEKNQNVFGPDSKVHGHNYILEVMVTIMLVVELKNVINLDMNLKLLI